MHTTLYHHYRRFLDLFSYSIISVLLSMSFFINSSFADEGFPGRKKYHTVNTISIEKLHEKVANNDVIIVDVRTEYEYQTINILNSVNISFSEKTFISQVEELRNTTTKDIVFYCNGRTCMKSYKATNKANKYNIKNCYTFDAGVFEWALAYPEQAVLLGETPVDEDKIISKDDFKSRQLLPKEFEQRLLEENSLIYDIRDVQQRRGSSGLFMFRDKRVDLSNKRKLDRIIAKAVENDTTLYFYDEKGRQIRWLQYSLESFGLENYYFMKGGASAYYDMIIAEQKKK